LTCEPTPRTDRSCPDDERHIHDRTKHYKVVQALTDLTLDVPSGTVFGFFGANGAGKTSAMEAPKPAIQAASSAQFVGT
jgi:ABC-2 type transport system ATP-binding protein